MGFWMRWFLDTEGGLRKCGIWRAVLGRLKSSAGLTEDLAALFNCNFQSVRERQECGIQELWKG